MFHRSGRSYLVLAGILTLSLMAAHRALDASTGSEKNRSFLMADRMTSPAPYPAAIPRAASMDEARHKSELLPPPSEPYVPPYARLAPKPLASTLSATSSAVALVEGAVKPDPVAADKVAMDSGAAAKSGEVAVAASAMGSLAGPAPVESVGIPAEGLMISGSGGVVGSAPAGVAVVSSAQPELAHVTKTAVQVAQDAVEASQKVLDALQQGGLARVGERDNAGSDVGKSSSFGVPTPRPLSLVEGPKSGHAAVARIPTPLPLRVEVVAKNAVALPPQAVLQDSSAKIVLATPSPLSRSASVAGGAHVAGVARFSAPEPAPLRVAELRQAAEGREVGGREVVSQVRAGDSLSDVLDRHQVPLKTSLAVSRASQRVFDLVKNLKPGSVLRMIFDQENQLEAIHYPVARDEVLEMKRKGDGTFHARLGRVEVVPTPGAQGAEPLAPDAVAQRRLRAAPEDVAIAMPRPSEDGSGSSSPVSPVRPAEPPVAVAAPDTGRIGTPRSKANHAMMAQMQQTFKTAHRTVKDFVRDGDHLAAILGRNEVDQLTTREVAVAARPVYDLAHHLQPGKGFRLAFGSDGELTALSYPVNDEETFLLTRDDNHQFVPKMVEHKLEHRIRTASSILNGSLFVASRKVGLSQQMGIKLAKLFEWDVDFARDIRTGDRFTVVYEEYLENGRSVRDGEILAAEFINQGHAYRVIRYTDPSGRTGYFDPDGQNVQKMFIRAPLDFLRISSQFSMKRKHPIFGFTRAHKGVDYAAPIGTLVRAAGDGVVVFRGRKSSFGNLVEVRHNGKYSTAYAHLSDFASDLHAGSRVRQGEILGRVGMTGVTTGPHLHYEVRLNGEAINPLSIQSPAAMPVAARHMPDFRKRSRQLVAMLDRSETMVASLPRRSER
ncbi:MAG: peptidoglycan DD-metalloendopeptidase family protein [Magnetococcales bacterium]|nr:peptidoglycan DD-metalloendopeptidase family protein [Magnetococcales bacterium]